MMATFEESQMAETMGQGRKPASSIMPKWATAALLGTSLLALGACSVAPKPFQSEDVIEAAIADKEIIFESQEPVDGALTLEEATARALKYNLAHRVQLMSQALASESFDLATYDMLPILGVEAAGTARDQFNASASESLATRLESLEPSFSEDRQRFTASARFSWNILDFGVSYLRAKQESDRFLIAGLAREKSARDLAQEVRIAFWRAAALQQVEGDARRLMEEAIEGRKELEEIRAKALQPPLETLEQIRALSEIIQQLETLEETASTAMVNLASLINVMPGTKLVLAVPTDLPDLPKLALDEAELEMLALSGSTDYQSELYNVRIDQREARKSILKLLPGLEIFGASNYDTNSFLAFDQWNEIGARVNWNLFRLLATDQIMDHNDARRLVMEARRLAANMATITQFHAARVSYHNALVRLSRAEDIDQLDKEIQRLTGQARDSQAASSTAALRIELRSLRSEVARMLAYAGGQQAWGNLLNALSLSPAPVDYQSYPTEELASIIKTRFESWQKGSFPKPVGDGEIMASLFDETPSRYSRKDDETDATVTKVSAALSLVSSESASDSN